MALPNLALSFDFFPVAGEAEYYYEQGTGQAFPPASPAMSVGGAIGSPADSTFQCSQPGPWVFGSGGTRYQILRDETTHKMRAMKSLDSGNTWAEVGAGSAPTVNNNAAAPNNFNSFACDRDTVSTNNVYVVFWDTDNTLSGITFTMGADTWGAIKKSTLGYTSVNVTTFPQSYGIAAAFRPSDSTFIVAFNSGGVTIGPNFFDRVTYAKFNCVAGTWGPWVPFGDTNALDQISWFVNGVVAVGSNLHWQFVTQTRSPGNWTIQHQVLHSDDSLSALDLIDTIGFLQTSNNGTYLGRPIGKAIPGGGTELLFPYNKFDNVASHIRAFVARGTAGDTPAWSIELVQNAGAGPTSFFGFALVDMGGGIVGGITLPGAAGGNTVWSTLQNNAPGAGWTLTPFATTTTNAAPGASAISIALASGVTSPSTNVRTFIGPITLPDPRLICRKGRQLRCHKALKNTRTLSYISEGNYMYVSTH